MFSVLRRVSFTLWIFIGMIVGALLGWLAPDFAAELKPLSTAFLRMIKSVVAPILFGTLVMGIAGQGDDLRKVGRLAWKSLLYFWAMTGLALVVGLVAPHITHPGVGVVIPPPDATTAAQIPRSVPTTFGGFVEHLYRNSRGELARMCRGFTGVDAPRSGLHARAREVDAMANTESP
ncbi:MAG TPA: cation:dicarboxylase symporter family transporter, partial [Gemmatimonadales bacterium]|nr:cation:dicarboxylase symporter family transporter [Gemmatimonadales bacterium]